MNFPLFSKEKRLDSGWSRVMKKINDLICKLCRFTEIAFSVIILLAIIVLILPIFYHFFNIPFLELTAGEFNEFLSNILTFLIGVEFVIMLIKHTAENLLEVLMFAIARQMIVEHLNMLETLIGVLAIAVVFAIRKYLLLKNTKEKETIYDEL